MQLGRTIMILCLALSAPAAGQSTGAQGTPKLDKPRQVPTPEGKPLTPATIDDQLQIGGADIKAREINTRMTVDVRINGRGPYRFLVDSGADSSVVGQRVARELQLPVGQTATLHTTTASAVVTRVVVDELSMGETTVRNLQLPALREEDMGGDGIIGIDALVRQRLMMDFERRFIKAEDASRPAEVVNGEIVVTARRRRGQLILTQVSANGLPLEAVVDTGSEISVGNLALRERLVPRNQRDKLLTVTAIGVTGAPLKMEVARVSEIRVGSVTLRDVPVAFADIPPFKLFGMSREPALLLGTDLLATFRRVSLDFQSRRVRFQLRRCGSTGIVISTVTADPWYSRVASDNANVCRR